MGWGDFIMTKNYIPLFSTLLLLITFMSPASFAADDDEKSGIKLSTSTKADDYDNLTNNGKNGSGYQVQVAAAVATEETEVPLSVSDDEGSTRYSSIKAIKNAKKAQKPKGMSFSQMALKFKSTPASDSTK